MKDHPLPTNYSFGKFLLRITFVNLLNLLLGAAFPVVDLMFLARLPNGDSATAALSLIHPAINVMIAFGYIVGMGASSYMSVKIGENKKELAEEYLGTSICLAFVIGLIFTILFTPHINDLLHLLGADQEITQLARQYVGVLVLTLPMCLVSNCLSILHLTDGSSKEGVLITLFALICNILMNTLFTTLNYGVPAISLATVISKCIMTLLSLYYFTKGSSYYKLKKKYFRLKLKYIITIFHHSYSALGVTLINNLIFIVILNRLIAYGNANLLSTFSIVMALSELIIIPAYSVAIGSMPLIAYCYGQGKYYEAKRLFILGILLATSMLTFLDLFIVFYPHQMVKLYTQNLEVQYLATKYFRLFLCMLPTFGLSVMTPVYLRCIGRPGLAGILMVIKQLVLLVPLIFILSSYYGPSGIFEAQPLCDIMYTILLLSILFPLLRKDEADKVGLNELLSKTLN